jgi:phosphopantetheinyl transferase (holo-ACP synthase)
MEIKGVRMENIDLKKLARYVNGKSRIKDVIELLFNASIATSILINPGATIVASSVFSIVGTSVSEIIEKASGAFMKKLDAEETLAIFDRCRYADLILVRLAVKEAIIRNFEGKDKIVASWKLRLTIDDKEKNKMEMEDTEREEKVFDKYFVEGSIDKDEYWKAFAESLVTIVDLEDNSSEEFVELFLDKIQEIYDALVGVLSCESEMFNKFRSSVSRREDSKVVSDELKLLEQFIKINGDKYRTIDEVDKWLSESTDPSISLNFFNYEDKEFEKGFIDVLNSDVIYVKGKTREEVIFNILYIIKNIEKDHACDTCVIDSLEHWNKLDGQCQGKVLIPKFYAPELKVISGNKCIIAYGDEDFIGSKNPIELKNRIISNMHDKLKDEVEDYDLVNEIINKSNGLYVAFKRRVFQGKMRKPAWEEKASINLVPALLIGQWTSRGSDSDILGLLTDMNYKKYKETLNGLISGEDPFLLEYDDFGKSIVKLANVEEAWEVLYGCITSDSIESFIEIVKEVLLDVPPKFGLPIDDHYKVGLLENKPLYSMELKEGLIRTLIMLANKDKEKNCFGIDSTQRLVDEVVRGILNSISTKEQWFAISESIDDLIEASPDIVLSRVENEIEKSESEFWDLFESQGSGIIGPTGYYTHVLWALEKALCLETYVPRTIKILAKLVDRKIEYKMSNSPYNTLMQALCAWVHSINISIQDKVTLTEIVASKYEIGWKVLEELLPGRSSGNTIMGMSKPRYRNYVWKHELKLNKEVYETYKLYTKIAIDSAGDDLEKWGSIFRKFTFIEFGFADIVIENTLETINNENDDTVKFKFKEIVRELLYRHRYFNKSNSTASKEFVDRVEKEVFDYIEFKNAIYDYLYLFIDSRPPLINPIPHKEEKWDSMRKREELYALRVETINMINNSPELGLENLVKTIPSDNEKYYGIGSIGAIVAKELHHSKIDMDFVKVVIDYGHDKILMEYMNSIIVVKSFEVLNRFFKEVEVVDEIKVRILHLVSVDENFLDFLEGFDEKLISLYWKGYGKFRDISNDSIRKYIWNHLLEYQNYSAAFNLLELNENICVENHIELLVKILQDPGDFIGSEIDSYDIENSFKFIYKQENHDEEIKQIILLEWAYFDIIRDRVTPKYLLGELKKNPEFLAELVSYAYKKSDDSDVVIEEGSEKHRLAVQAFKVLYGLKFCPCVDEGLNINVEELEVYVSTYLKKIDKNRQTAIGRQILGECFSKSPIAKDGGYPNEAVREMIEKYYDDNMKKGFYNGIVYDGKVVCGTNGEREKKLAVNYERYYKKCNIEYPKTAEILKTISDSYYRDSLYERERASYGF